jgi:hypothetical protein
MVAYSKVPPAAFGKRDPGDKYRRPPESVDPVDMIARLHSAEAEAARSADAAGPRAENDEISFHQCAAGGQGRINIYRFKPAAESMAAGYRAAEQPFFLEPGDDPAESKRQGCFAGHDIGNPAGGPVIFQHRRGGSNHAVQLSDEHGCFPETVKAGQPRPVTGFIFLTAEHPHLPGGIAELHDMAAAAKPGQRAA